MSSLLLCTPEAAEAAEASDAAEEAADGEDSAGDDDAPSWSELNCDSMSSSSISYVRSRFELNTLVL